MRIAVLVSGGVDSSVALHLLAEQGHEVEAVYLKIWLEDELAHLGECPWEDDLTLAREVCDRLAVPLHVVSLQRRYRETVVASALRELRLGRTPSPDILCNREIKFGAAFEGLGELVPKAPEAFASGHYARLRDSGDARLLLRGLDPVKDQTYFLHRLEQAQLRRLLFPLGAFRKREVRRMAAERDLPNRERPDSQGICFLGRIPFTEFVREHLGERPGPIVDADTGEMLGEHRGHWFFTIGQRRGLGLGGGPWYVTAKDVPNDRILVGHRRVPEGRRSRRILLEGCHWISGAPEPSGTRLEARIRHGPRTTPGLLRRVDPDGTGAELVLDRPEEGVAPGQAAVLYAGEVCLGGGWIRAAD